MVPNMFYLCQLLLHVTALHCDNDQCLTLDNVVNRHLTNYSIFYLINYPVMTIGRQVVAEVNIDDLSFNVLNDGESLWTGKVNSHSSST